VKNPISNPCVSTIGLDLGDRRSCYAEIDEDGLPGIRGKVRTDQGSVTKLFGSLPSCRVALEVGTHSPWVSELLSALGHEVIVANPRCLPLIYKSTRKTDPKDALKLARLARSDPELLCPIRHRGSEARADLSIVRARDALVRARTKLINSMKGMVKSMGARIPGSISADALHKKAKPYVPAVLAPAVGPIIRALAHLTAQIQGMDRALKELCRDRYPETQQLCQVAGVGAITSLTYVLTVDDPLRFSRSREVGAYLGLVPRKSSSGQRDPELPISKAGDRELRRLLVQCSHYILGRRGPDTALRRWGLKLAARGGKNAKKRAVVAVARKLSVLLHRLWITGEEYEPLRNAEVVA
jgi:transposase